MDPQTHKDALLRKRGEILGTGGIKPLQASMENNTRQGDMADQASGNNEVHIALKLKQTDAKILQAIEEALLRLDKGTYGICRDCGEPIAPARLNAIPWTRVCITCKGRGSPRRLPSWTERSPSRLRRNEPSLETGPPPRMRSSRRMCAKRRRS